MDCTQARLELAAWWGVLYLFYLFLSYFQHSLVIYIDISSYILNVSLFLKDVDCTEAELELAAWWGFFVISVFFFLSFDIIEIDLGFRCGLYEGWTRTGCLVRSPETGSPRGRWANPPKGAKENVREKPFLDLLVSKKLFHLSPCLRGWLKKMVEYTCSLIDIC